MSNFQNDIRDAVSNHFQKVENAWGPRDSEQRARGNHELEFRIGNFIPGTENFNPKMPLSKFKQIVGTLKKLSEQKSSQPSNLQLTEAKEPEISVDVSLQNTKFLPQVLRKARTSISGNDIRNFCSNSEISNLEIKSKAEPTNITDWNLRLQSSIEEQVTDPKLIAQFSSLLKDPHYQKYFRLKKRKSFFGPMVGSAGNQFPLFRVDATIVKESSGSTFELANIYGAPEAYELEIEAAPDKLLATLSPADKKEAAQLFYESIIDILGIVKRSYDDTIVPVSQKEKEQVALEYVVASYPETERANTNFTLENPKQRSRFFIGMEVNPLEPRYLTRNPNGDIWLLDGSYYVTMKADGTRDLLYFPLAAEGRGYLLDRNLNVRYTGLVRPELAGALFDGEYIDSTNEYLIFDYLMEPGGKDIRPLKFSERLKLLKNLNLMSTDDPKNARRQEPKQYVRKDTTDLGEPGYRTPEEPMQLKVKEHYHIPKSSDMKTLGETIRKIERSPTMKLYQNDGYIFTPDEPYPVASLKHKVTWDKLLKWKPLSLLSIDFLVKKVLRPDGTPQEFQAPGSSNRFQTLILLANYGGTTKPFSYPRNFVEGADNVARVLIDNRDGQIRTQPDKSDEGIETEKPQVIYDDTVVEFAWKTLPSGAFVGRTEGWVPIRVREDKTELRKPNAIRTAQSNWELIKFPVSLEMLKGEEELPPTYYIPVDKSLRDLTKPFRRFHNAVKRDLIVGAANEIRKEEGANTPIRILDLGVGQGGDLDKWGNAKAKSVLGIDFSRNNLEQGEGAFSRYEEQKDKYNYKVDVDFVWGDVTKNIATLDAAFDNTSSSSRGVKKGTDNSYRNRLALALQKNIPGFNIISIMFAIHYFFKDEATLRGVFRNVSELLLPGGYLIGTTLDGDKVLQAFRNAKTNTLVGMEPNRKIELWSIRKDFKLPEEAGSSGQPDVTDEDYIETNRLPTGPFGRPIYVKQISIGQEFKEYLVDFEYLARIAAEYGLEPVEFGNFAIGGDFSNYTPSAGGKQPVKGPKTGRESLSAPEKIYNDLNRYFIFKKTSDRPTVLEKERIISAAKSAAGPSQPGVATESSGRAIGFRGVAPANIEPKTEEPSVADMVQDDYVAPFSAESTYAANAPLPQLGLPAPKPTITSSVQRPALKTLSRPFSRKVSTATAATAATTISSSQTGTVGATPVSSLQTGTSAPVAAKSTLSRRAPRTATTTSRLTSATTTTATTVPAPTPVPVQVPAPATTVSVPIPVAATTVPVSAPATTVQTVPATTTRQLGPARMKALSTLRRPARAAGETASTTSIKPEERAEPTESGIATGAIAETSSTTATPSTAGTRRTLRPGLRRGVAGVATQTQSTTNP